MLGEAHKLESRNLGLALFRSDIPKVDAKQFLVLEPIEERIERWRIEELSFCRH